MEPAIGSKTYTTLWPVVNVCITCALLTVFSAAVGDITTAAPLPCDVIDTLM